MATELVLKRADDGPLGNVVQLQELLGELFPGARFAHRPSGAEMLRMLEQQDRDIPDEYRRMMETMPARWDGIYEDEDFSIEFCMADEDPVRSLFVVPRGIGIQTDERLARLEQETGGRLSVSGDEW